MWYRENLFCSAAARLSQWVFGSPNRVDYDAMYVFQAYTESNLASPQCADTRTVHDRDAFDHSAILQ